MPAMRREQLLRALPYARRYARALTGSQERGDALVTTTLQRVLAEPETAASSRVALYAGITMLFDQDTAAQTVPVGLDMKQRQLLLPTWKTTFSTDLNAWSSMSCFNARL